MSDRIFIVARLPLGIGPIDRGELWEDPLDERLSAQKLGDVTGGGTMMGEDGDIDFVDLELALPDTEPSRLDRIAAMLEDMGAPRETQLIDDDGKTLRTCGKNAVAGIGLDGTGLPSHVYDTFDPDEFNDEILAGLGAGYKLAGSHMAQRYTYFRYVGPDAAHLATSLRAVADGKPICQGARFQLPD